MEKRLTVVMCQPKGRRIGMRAEVGRFDRAVDSVRFDMGMTALHPGGQGFQTGADLGNVKGAALAVVFLPLLNGERLGLLLTGDARARASVMVVILG